ncbi:MAG: thiamine phosphate synthase [Sphingorhabdus sp.]
MTRRQTLRPTKRSLPHIWLMTDPRLGEGLLPAIKRLPAGSGVIFRHYELDAAARLSLFGQIRRLCRQRGHMLLLAGDERAAQRWHADGFHSRDSKRQSRQMVHSAPVHNRRELAAAQRGGVDLVFLSPIFATKSHPGARALGRAAFMALAKQCKPKRVIALGGMSARKAVTLSKNRVHGWAAIDAFRERVV